jgi:hypothetical protein
MSLESELLLAENQHFFLRPVLERLLVLGPPFEALGLGLLQLKVGLETQDIFHVGRMHDSR